ncbi:MAG: hypothetical protein Q8Q04_00310 [archaeon]|nr:hypothetical protein [archaeon]
MEKEKFQYLIKNKIWDNYLQKCSEEVYSPVIKTAIHEEVPSWITEEELYRFEIIRSDSQKFKDRAQTLKECD